MSRYNAVTLAVLFLSLTALTGCQDPVIDTAKLLRSEVDQPEIVGIVAGFGTIFAAFPDLLAMLRRRSSEGMNPRMGAIMGDFQTFVGLLRLIDRLAASDHMERDRGLHPLSDRRRIRSFRPHRKERSQSNAAEQQTSV
jgi:hypothetical protein